MEDTNPSSNIYEKDIESGVDVREKPFDGQEKSFDGEDGLRHGSVVPEDEVVVARKIQHGFAPFRYLSKGEAWLDHKLGVETQGIDRIPEEAKQPPSIWNIFLIWFSMTLHVGTLPIGFLGPEFGLTLNQSVAAIVVGTFLGALCTGYCGTLGPRTGLRAIATSRYSFGFYGAKLCSVLNVVIGGGFAVVNIVICGQMLSAVSNYHMTISVGCVIVGIISYGVSVFGFQVIHTYEKYAWFAGFLLITVLIGQAGPHVDPGASGFDTGLALSGSFLSFLTVCFSSSSGWCSIAADYYCNYPAKTPQWKIFTMTTMGVTVPTVFVTVIGACIGNMVFLVDGGESAYHVTYEAHGLGGVIHDIYHPNGWAKFALVILTFTVVGNNVAVFYSSGLSIQLLGHYFHAVPRLIWSFLTALVVTIIAVVGKDHLSSIVSNFVSLLGYWTISFTFILLIEDKWFRRHEGYNLFVWDNPHKLPWGLAAVMALLSGYLAGGVTGMSQIWYIGPIAKKFGPYGGDVGVFLSGVITLVVYPPGRYLERKYTGR